MQEKIKSLILEAIKNLGINEDVYFAIEHPEDLKNGDYSTNVAMVLSKRLEKNPRELAEEIVEFLRSDLKNSKRSDLGKLIQGIEVAGPGFINFYLSREFFTESIKEILKKGENWGKNSILTGKKIMVEYTDPNPFKPFHIGHLMTNAIGESISRVVEFSGAKVVRANYQGDVGPHVAKAIYIILHSKEYKEVGLPNILGSDSEKAMWIGKCYSEGSNLYDTDENVKKEIDEINRKIYDKSDKDINDIYAWGRAITLDAFEEIYKILGTKFDKYFFESKMAPIGEKIVRQNIGKVKDSKGSRGIFEESNGAIIFPAEKYDPKLHTRVFINSQGLPTYETKEIGLTTEKFKKGIFEKSLYLSIVITATEQADYMKVVQKAIALLHPELEKKMKHITHGMMRFTDGKMSSRKGNVVTGESLLRDSMDVVHEKIIDREFNNNEKENIARIVGVSALKYSILKSSIGSDIVYDQEKSISFDGDSGPYLQYTAVRANSILEKSKNFDLSNKNTKSSETGSPDVSEKAFIEIPENVTDLEKKIYQFGEVVEYSYKEFAPHHIAIYLTELASSFNTFYSSTQILKEDNPCMAYHLDLVRAFYQTMKNGLWLLGIEVPERM